MITIYKILGDKSIIILLKQKFLHKYMILVICQVSALKYLNNK